MDKKQRIAIVGIGGVFPGANDLHEFWQNIISARDCAREPPAGRWLLSLDDVYHAGGPLADKVYSRRACFVDQFRPDLDGLRIDENFVQSLDPMFHLLLHAGNQAWRDGVTQGIDTKRAGVIIGNIALPTDAASSLADEILLPVFEQQILAHVSAYPKTNRLNRYVAGLPAGILARALGLGGGSYTLDAACASSLYAVKYAVDELQAGRADAMLCGGLSRPDSLYTQMGFSALHAISASGRCSPFDHKGDGLVVGEGCGMFLLKRLDDAVRDNDRIYATIAGIGLSNDIGGNLMSPDSEGQLRAMHAAYEQAGWIPDQVDLIECHGTGTPVGDAVEFNSLTALWGEGRSKSDCVIGSVKSNIGHLLTAAGSAGLVKVLLAMQHKQLPPTANFESATDTIDLDGSSFTVLRTADEWQQRAVSVPRRAAVSAFGFGGINAHVLLEEWREKQYQAIPVASRLTLPDTEITPGDDIAIVGMDACIGPCQSMPEFQHRVLGNDYVGPDEINNTWGIELNIKGYPINEVSVPVGRFRIPPNELKDMLPQQLLMLQVAANAIDDAGIRVERHTDLIDTGVYIGIGLDLNTTNFHVRWHLLNKAREWALAAGLQLSEQALQEWVTQLRDACGPPLSANRTMGALGGIVASRIARAFNIGGPAFTLSGEESSGLRSLEAGVRALQRHEIDTAIVGAVDFSSDIRALTGQDDGRPYSRSGITRPFDRESDGTVAGDGAVAVILKRYEDAVRAGDRIYAIVKGMGSASGGAADDLLPDVSAGRASLQRSLADARVSIDSIGYLECHGSGYGAEDDMEAAAIAHIYKEYGNAVPCAIGSVKADIGHSGAAGGLASIAKTGLCLYHGIIPSLRSVHHLHPVLSGLEDKVFVPSSASYWLRNRADGPRRALVNSFSVDGNCVSAVLEGIEDVAAPQQTETVSIMQPLGDVREALFAIAADSEAGLINELGRLQQLINTSSGLSMPVLAGQWWDSGPDNVKAKLALSMIAGNHEQLIECIAQAQRCIGNREPVANDNLFYSPEPLAGKGRLAFVFPGSGSHYADMGKELSCFRPGILKELDKEFEYLAGQFANGRFWSHSDSNEFSAEDCIFGQVWCGTMVHDVVTSFGIVPDAVIGYCLGESIALFATRTWKDRDLMLQRMRDTALFTRDLAGPCEAARRVWGLSRHEAVDWQLGVIDRPAEEVKQILQDRERVYLMIINAPNECVIGGDRHSVQKVVRDLRCNFHPLQGVTTVHCEVVRPVQQAYRELHLFDTTPPQGLVFYSGVQGSRYDVTRDSAADSIMRQALETFDNTKLVNAAYADGVRCFIEMGPGAACSRMIAQILGDRRHVARAICVRGQSEVANLLRVLAILYSERYRVDLGSLYRTHDEKVDAVAEQNRIIIPAGRQAVNVPLPISKRQATSDKRQVKEEVRTADIISYPRHVQYYDQMTQIIEHMAEVESAGVEAQQAFLKVSNGISASLGQALSLQMSLLQSLPESTRNHINLETPLSPPHVPESEQQVAYDRSMCLEFATGSIARMLGAQFAEVDHFPTRVRLPDEPLMLVDRIIKVEGEPCSMIHGRVVTEHDVLPGTWYLDCGRIPTCIAVEAGQADLFLSGYLGIDLQTRGLAVYRLLDAEVTFHGALPQAGETIRYDIHIDRFFRQGDTWLFRFHFDGTVNGDLLITMRNGCAGFFTSAELESGKGIVRTALELQPLPGKRPEDWTELVPMQNESYDDAQITALRAGDLPVCFGPAFAGLDLTDPVGLPAGRMTLVHRVLDLDPAGGRYGLGKITGEADIHPDDWFLTCHFVDDQVMPGTLMYECCLHTLRIFLLRMGWIGETGSVAYEPVPGIPGKLKCRGQVIRTTEKVQYEISIKELGYTDNAGTPYVIADALMYGDGKPIVQMLDMSLQLTGLTRSGLETLWRSQSAKSETRAIFDHASILAFATGKPSAAFGDRYQVFDHDRIIARLPGPPFQFLDRIVAIRDCRQWELTAGGEIRTEYDVPADAWYFAADRQQRMPYSVLLEVALQPCGWLAAYLGSALKSDIDLSFRNLGGSGVQRLAVFPDSGTLSVDVKITNVALSGGMIIQNFDFKVGSRKGTVYQGNTYFGFFSKQALANQVGIRDAVLYQPDATGCLRDESFVYPDYAPYPAEQMRMIDNIVQFEPDGGTHGLGYICGIARVRPEAWFFKAHFYQDPVWPGSLGLESFVQLLKVVAHRRWAAAEDAENWQFESMALGQPHSWTYRGQIVPEDSQVTVQAVITETDDKEKWLQADGFLTVDGRIIYQMTDFALKMLSL